MSEVRSIYQPGETAKKTIEELGRLLSLIYRRQYERINVALKPLQITAFQSVLLVNVFRHPGLTPSQLAELISIDKATMSRILYTLISRGLMNRDPGENRRSYRLSLTEQGEALVRRSLSMQVDVWENFLLGISQEDREHLLVPLRKIYDNLQGGQ